MRHTLKNFVRRSVIFENDEENLNKFSDLILVSPKEAARHILAAFLATGRLPKNIFLVPHPNFKVIISYFGLRLLRNRDLKSAITKFVEFYRGTINKTLVSGGTLPFGEVVGKDDFSVANCPISIKGIAEWGIRDYRSDSADEISEDFKKEFVELVKKKLESLFNKKIFSGIFSSEKGKSGEVNLDELRDKFMIFIDYIAGELYSQVQNELVTPSSRMEIFTPSVTWVTHLNKNGAISIASLHRIEWLVSKENGEIDGKIERLVDVWLERIKNSIKSKKAKFLQGDNDKLIKVIERIEENGELHKIIILSIVGYVNKSYEYLCAWLNEFLIEIVRLVSDKVNIEELLNSPLSDKSAKVEKGVEEKGVEEKGKRKYFFYL